MTSGNFVLHNKCFSLKEPQFYSKWRQNAAIFCERQVPQQSLYIPTVPVNGIVELENEKPSASVYQLSVDFDVKTVQKSQVQHVL